MKTNEKYKTKFNDGLADFFKNKIIVLKEPTENSDIIEDDSVISPLNFDQIIESGNKKYISYITISGIRRYSLLADDTDIKATIKTLDAETYKWNIFNIYKKYYIDNYIPPKEPSNKKSLSTFINTLYINIQPKALTLCAQFVHWAMNVAGFKFQGKYSAKLYHLEGLLKELGFYEILQNSQLKKGDIIVIVDEQFVNLSYYYGHICAYDGKYFLCDDKETTLSDFNKAHIYRYDLWDE